MTQRFFAMASVVSLMGVVSVMSASCGDEVSIEEDAPLEGALRAWPELRMNLRGPDVHIAQILLRHRGETVSGDRDGDFGPATDAAVRHFQQVSGLVADGAIGARTWEALIDDVHAGSRSAAVLALQTVLERGGHDADLALVDEKEAQFAGEETLAVLRREQAQRCLVVSGAAGVYTWSALLGDFDYCDGGPDERADADELARAAHDAGVPCGDALQLAVSIALAEAGGRSTDIRRNIPTSGCSDGSYDVGAWQINDCYHPTVGHSCALRLSCAAQKMYDISRNATDWSPWSTFENGFYKGHLDAAVAAEVRLCGRSTAVEDPVAKRSR